MHGRRFKRIYWTQPFYSTIAKLSQASYFRSVTQSQSSKIVWTGETSFTQGNQRASHTLTSLDHSDLTWSNSAECRMPGDESLPSPSSRSSESLSFVDVSILGVALVAAFRRPAPSSTSENWFPAKGNALTSELRVDMVELQIAPTIIVSSIMEAGKRRKEIQVAVTAHKMETT
jgi:hypothetical protein